MFNEHEFDRIIIIEDDMLVAPDFFDYFFALGPILTQDPTVWCISAWNDHGLVMNISIYTYIYMSTSRKLI